MRNILPHLLFILLSICSLRAHAQTRFKEKVFKEIAKATYFYADTLKLDFYSSPKDKAEKKPLVLLMHGGGFARGSREGGLEQHFAIPSPRKGMVLFP